MATKLTHIDTVARLSEGTNSDQILVCGLIVTLGPLGAAASITLTVTVTAFAGGIPVVTVYNANGTIKNGPFTYLTGTGTFTTVCAGAADAALYTIEVSERDNVAGLVTLNVDRTDSTAAVWGNASFRGFTGAGDNPLTMNFINTGVTNKFIIRGIGPTLIRRGTANTAIINRIGNPSIECHDNGGTLVDFNDNFGSYPNIGQVRFEFTGSTTNLTADPNVFESNILVGLLPTTYHAMLRNNGYSGIGLIEIYSL